MSRALLLVVVAACAHEVAAAPAPRTTTVAVAEVVSRDEECTGLGGEHYVIRLLDGSRRVLHAGGHGARLGLIPEQGFGRAFVVVDVELAGKSGLVAAAPCVDDLPKFDGYARRVVRAKTLADAKRMHARLVRDGLPKRDAYRQTQLYDPDARPSR
ncbi:MAG: hypothetical protein H0V17_20740 [Deltaproteobacteria bacterium]|nr:hypothetical protein [Deltaproteobacteria bacterium]